MLKPILAVPDMVSPNYPEGKWGKELSEDHIYITSYRVFNKYAVNGQYGFALPVYKDD